MRCDDVNELLWEAAETGTIPEALSNHLADCTHCRESLHALQSAVRGCHTLHEVQAIQVPGIAVLLNTRSQQAQFPLRLVAALAACLTLVVVLGLRYLWTRQMAQHNIQSQFSHQPKMPPVPQHPLPPEKPSLSPTLPGPEPGVSYEVGHYHRRKAVHPVHHSPPKAHSVSHPSRTRVVPEMDIPDVQTSQMELASSVKERVKEIKPGEDIMLDTDQIASVSGLPITYAITPVAGSYETLIAQADTKQVIRIFTVRQ